MCVLFTDFSKGFDFENRYPSECNMKINEMKCKEMTDFTDFSKGFDFDNRYPSECNMKLNEKKCKEMVVS